MSGKPYDAAVRTLIGTRPEDWLRFLKLPTGMPVTILDTDLSVISAATDGLLRVGGEEPFGIHFEFETGHHGAKLPSRLCAYNSQAAEQTGLVFLSVLVLLNPSTDSPGITGALKRRLPGKDGRLVCTFEYEVLRVWQIAPERFLEAGFGLLPFAPTGDVALPNVPLVIERMTGAVERAVTEARLSDSEANEIWYATYILMGPRYGKELSKQLLRKVKRMRESPTFQAILEEGREEGRQEGREEGIRRGIEQGIEQGSIETLRKTLLYFGAKRFGQPSPQVRSRLEAVRFLAELEVLQNRFDAVETWDELLQEPTP